MRKKQSVAPHVNQGSEHETHNDLTVRPILNSMSLLARKFHLGGASPGGCQSVAQKTKYRARKQAGQVLVTGLSRAITMVALGGIHTWPCVERCAGADLEICRSICITQPNHSLHALFLLL